MDVEGAWVVSRLVAGVDVEEADLQGLEDPWRSAAEALRQSSNGGRVNALRAWCDTLDEGDEIFKTILAQDPRKQPERREVFFGVPPLPKKARVAPGLGDGCGGWLDMYVAYAKEVSPLTPRLFHTGAGLWLVSLAIARRVVLRLAHKDLYPNLAVLQVADTTLYAKSTGLSITRMLVQRLMRHLLLPGAMTPESIYSELAGQQPTMLSAEDVEDWNKGRDFSGQRGVCLDEASSVFVGMKKDYNIGMNEQLCRLYDCTESDTRQTKSLGRLTVRQAYWTFLGATTPWHLKQADIDSLWHTGLWPRFLLLTPAGDPHWERPHRDRSDVPGEIVARLERLIEQDLPESQYMKPAEPISMGLGEGVFDAFSAYLEATMHTLLKAPTVVDKRLGGTYGRLAEHAMKVAMLLAVLDWNGVGAPVIGLGHWARGQRFGEQCRESAHRLTQMLAQDTSNEEEMRVLCKLQEQPGVWLSARDVYKPLKMRSTTARAVLGDLVEAGLVEERNPSAKRMEYRWVAPGEREQEIASGQGAPGFPHNARDKLQ